MLIGATYSKFGSGMAPSESLHMTRRRLMNLILALCVVVLTKHSKLLDDDR